MTHEKNSILHLFGARYILRYFLWKIEPIAFLCLNECRRRSTRINSRRVTHGDRDGHQVNNYDNVHHDATTTTTTTDLHADTTTTNTNTTAATTTAATGQRCNKTFPKKI